jgi:hypothetical protein
MNYGIEHRLHALVLKGGAAHRDDNLAAQGPLAKAAANLFRRQLAALQELVEQGVVAFCGGLNHFSAPQRDVVFQFRWDFASLIGHAHV